MHTLMDRAGRAPLRSAAAACALTSCAPGRPRKFLYTARPSCGPSTAAVGAGFSLCSSGAGQSDSARGWIYLVAASDATAATSALRHPGPALLARARSSTDTRQYLRYTRQYLAVCCVLSAGCDMPYAATPPAHTPPPLVLFSNILGERVVKRVRPPVWLTLIRPPRLACAG